MFFYGFTIKIGNFHYYIRNQRVKIRKYREFDGNREVHLYGTAPLILFKSESVEFLLIESVICLLTDSSVKKYFSLTNQLIFTDWISKKKYFSLLNQFISTEVIREIWQIYSNLFLAIWISQISLIISRFWLIQI